LVRDIANEIDATDCSADNMLNRSHETKTDRDAYLSSTQQGPEDGAAVGGPARARPGGASFVDCGRTNQMTAGLRRITVSE